jgi:hypothetical protein
MMVYKDIIQGSEAWLQIRKGKVTASRVAEIITPTGAFSKSSKALAYDLIGECVAPEFVGFAGNLYTDRGTDLEPEARDVYRAATGHTVEEVGFVTMDGNRSVIGCSPDGLLVAECVGYWGGVELKCPAPKTFIEWVAEGVLPAKHKAQVHASLYVTGLDQWDFCAYFPGLKPFIVTVKPDDYTAKLGAAIEEFIVMYAAMRAEILPKIL